MICPALKLEREIQKAKELEIEKMKEKVMLEKEFEEKMKQVYILNHMIIMKFNIQVLLF